MRGKGALPRAQLCSGGLATMKHDVRTGLLLALCGFAILSVGDAILKSIEGEWTAIAAGALGIARARQSNKEGFTQRAAQRAAEASEEGAT